MLTSERLAVGSTQPIRVDATHRVLSAAVRLRGRDFTLGDLATDSSVRANTVRTIVSRNQDFFDFLGYRSTGRKGGRERLLRVKPDRLSDMLARVRGPTSEPDIPVGIRVALRRLVDDLPKLRDEDTRARLQRAITRNLAEDAHVESSSAKACRDAALFLLESSQPWAVSDSRLWDRAQELSARLAAVADSTGQDKLHHYRAEVLKKAGDIRLTAALMPLMLSIIDSAVVYLLAGSLPRARVVRDLTSMGLACDVAEVMAEHVRAFATTCATLSQPQVLLSDEVVYALTGYTSARRLIVRMSRCTSALALEIIERCGSAFDDISVVDNADLRLGRMPVSGPVEAVLLYESVALIRRDQTLLRSRESALLSGNVSEDGVVVRYVLVDESDSEMQCADVALAGFRRLMNRSGGDLQDSVRISPLSCSDDTDELALVHNFMGAGE